MRTLRLISIGFSLLLLASAATDAQGGGSSGGNPGKGKGKPKVEFDDKETPLRKAMKEAAKKKANAPEMEESDSSKESKRGEKVVAKTVRTKLVFKEHKASQRKDEDKWGRVKLRGRRAGEVGNLGNVQTGSGFAAVDVLRARFSTVTTADNEDRDCIDRVTGERFGGPVVQDGDESSCFDANGTLKETLSPAPDQENACLHTSGRLLFGDPTDFFEDDCFDESNSLKSTSLEELIDEDGGEGLDNDADGLFDEDPPDGVNNDGDCENPSEGVFARGDACFEGGVVKAGWVELVDEDGPDPEDLDGDGVDDVDQDGDGRFDEDGAQPASDPCIELGGEQNPDTGECDLTRFVVKMVNEKAMETLQQKVYCADEEGNELEEDCSKSTDNSLKKAARYGDESRMLALTELFTVECEDEDAELVDGVCVVPEGSDDSGPLNGQFETAAVHFDAGSSVSTSTERAMMGFTFAPPVLKWGYSLVEEACIPLIGCVELIAARVGYEFDVAAGLRLPIEVKVSEIPAEVTAEDSLKLPTGIEPLDFTVEDYKSFCMEHQLKPWCPGGNPVDVDRFAIPEFMHSLVTDELLQILNIERQGAEVLAQETVFAGIQVRLAGVSVIDWALDSNVNLPAICTLKKIKEKIEEDPQISFADLDDFAVVADPTRKLLERLGDQIPSCQSFTTPFGRDEEGELRTFPFAEGASIEIPADCSGAEEIKIGKKRRPMCTGLVLGAHGASLGVGLGLELRAGSNLITANLTTAGDADPIDPPQQLRYCDPEIAECDPETELEATVDNRDPSTDVAELRIDDFTYFLGTLVLTLKANLQFGGILSPISDLPSFEIFKLVLDLQDDGFPIGQHEGTRPITNTVFVKNYALALEGRLAPGDPEKSDPSRPYCSGRPTLQIRPGEGPGSFLVDVENLGSVRDTFSGFSPGLAECPPGTEACDPDLQAKWALNWSTPDPRVEIEAHTKASDALTLLVEPGFDRRIPPDEYRLRVEGDSETARTWCEDDDPTTPCLKQQDPLDHFRRGASTEVCVRVLAVYSPLLALADEPAPVDRGKPGERLGYTVSITNGGNLPDTFTADQEFRDSNTAGCGLAERGRVSPRSDCPYRAEITRIADPWVTDDLEISDEANPNDAFEIEAPSEWAGMQDTDYEILITAVSEGSRNDEKWIQDKGGPATRSQLATLTVLATKESMTRYIGLELDELIASIEQANSRGIRTGGLLQIARVAERRNGAALNQISSGRMAAASRIHRANYRLMGAFLRALQAWSRPGGVRTALADEWRLRGRELRVDIDLAAASDVSSAP